MIDHRKSEEYGPISIYLIKTKEELLQAGHYLDPEDDFFIDEEMYKRYQKASYEDLENQSEISALSNKLFGQVIGVFEDPKSENFDNDDLVEYLETEFQAVDGFSREYFNPITWGVKKELKPETDPEYFI